MAIILDKIITFGLLLTVVFTVLAHGAVEAWSVAIFELLILLLLFLWAIKCVAERKIEIRVPATFFPSAAFLAYALFQSLVWTSADGTRTSLSFDPEATRSTAVILFFLLAAHLIATNFFATRQRLKTLVIFVGVFGLAFAVLALVQYFTLNNFFFLLRPASRTSGGMVTGSFVNHNHFAGYMELLIPIPIALVFAGALKHTRLLLAFAAAMMAIAAIAALSRGGMISLAGGGLFLLTAIVYQTSRNGSLKNRITNGRHAGAFQAEKLSWLFNLAGALMIAGAIALGTFLVGAEPVIDRLTNNNLVVDNAQAQSFENARGWMWRNSLKMFEANPLFGVGLGAYQTAFPQYSESDGILEYGKPFIFDRAHNDYLQILTDTGIVGAFLAVWFVALLLVNITRTLKLKDSLCRGLAVGSGAAIISLIIHSFFDFSLQLPAIALLFLVVTAISVNLPLVAAEREKHFGRAPKTDAKYLLPETSGIAAAERNFARQMNANSR